MKKYSVLLAVLLFSTTAVLRADTMVFDRGLPTVNLNNAAGASRSNVAWAFGQDPGEYYATGDTFNFGTAGQTYTITDLRVWIVGSGTTPLSSIFNSLTLSGGGLTAATVNDISTVSTTGGPNVGIKAVQYADGSTYQGSLGYSDLFQVDFLNLNWTVNGGTTYSFFVGGVPAQSDHGPFLHASNAALSGSEQDGVDNQFLSLGRSTTNNANMDVVAWDSATNGWDKSSDINVQIFATPEPGSIVLLGTLILGICAGLRRRATVV